MNWRQIYMSNRYIKIDCFAKNLQVSFVSKQGARANIALDYASMQVCLQYDA